MILPNYVKIPREIIYDTALTDKRIIIFSYLCARRSLDDTVAFSTTELCHWSNMKPNYRDGKINQKYYEVLLLLSHYGYFIECPDFEKCLGEKTNSVKYQNLKLNIEKFDISDNYGIIYLDELEKILHFKDFTDNNSEFLHVSNSYVLLVLAYIRVNMNRSKDNPMCCYRHYKKISEDIGISERYVSKVVAIFDEMRIIKNYPMKREKYIVDGKEQFLTTPKIFADYRRYTRDDLGNQILDVNYDPTKEIEMQLQKIKSAPFHSSINN